MNKPAKRPRGRPRGFDRDKALESALRLFWTRGFEATSISELTEAMGINPPALYAAFGDKKHLFLQAVARYEEEAGCFAQKAFEEPTAKGAMSRLLHGAVEAFTKRGAPRGCLVVLGATNCAAESAEIYDALAARRRKAEKAVRARIAAGQAAGELDPDQDVEALAGTITATLFGLAIKAKDGLPPSQLHRIVDQTMRTWPDKARAARTAIRPDACRG